jgi:hypothetical protein
MELRMADQMMKLADAYTRTGGNGNVYQVAYLANLKLLIFPVHDPQPDGPSHTLFVTPRPPRQDQRSSAPSPRSAGVLGSPAPVVGPSHSRRADPSRPAAWPGPRAALRSIRAARAPAQGRRLVSAQPASHVLLPGQHVVARGIDLAQHAGPTPVGVARQQR